MEFLTRGWFWMVLGGAVLTAAAGAVGTTGTSRWWLVPAVLGLVLTMTGILLLFRPRFRFAELGTAQLRLVIGAGLVSGIIAFLVASFIEGRLEPRMHVPFAVDLWLAGAIEETCKLAVPVLLLIFSRRRFGDPRAGVLMVLISAAVFGLGEGIQYITSGTSANSSLLLTLVRPLTEISHPLWTAVAAGAIWLAAHRSGRVLTWVGLAGWLVSSLLHSVHDGLFSAGQQGTQNRTTDLDAARAARAGAADRHRAESAALASTARALGRAPGHPHTVGGRTARRRRQQWPLGLPPHRRAPAQTSPI